MSIHKDVEKVLITEEQIVNRCKELGKELSNYYKDETPIAVGLLKGSIPFLAELVKHITIDIEMAKITD